MAQSKWAQQPLPNLFKLASSVVKGKRKVRQNNYIIMKKNKPSSIPESFFCVRDLPEKKLKE